MSLGDVWFRGARLTWSILSVRAPLALGWSLPIHAGVVVCAGGASTLKGPISVVTAFSRLYLIEKRCYGRDPVADRVKTFSWHLLKQREQI